ncbi:Trehalose utilisation [Fodinibius roseus]|uniref:Trehalose utilisation n=1 Tax=Fodinibius roseus TaxID=1194090 RepID=A0A1M4TMP6_9BACT|nr:ThuA domain-containing protein [Fodinibius roseus]SHE45740.1 Trehalose utilisation [Fodinibius roseus]
MNMLFSTAPLSGREERNSVEHARLPKPKIFFAGLAFLVALLVGTVPLQSKALGQPSNATGIEQHASEDQPHVVFLINEDPHNYEAHKTIPPFADRLGREHNYKTTVIEAEGELPALRFPRLRETLSGADLLVIYFRRASLPAGQLAAIKSYIAEGNPVIGIRTANHAFAVRDQDGEIPEGYEDWPEFVPEILGQENIGYGSVEDGTAVAVAPGAADHPILEGFEPIQWQSTGNIYLIRLLDDQARVLLSGMAGDHVNPVAYTRRAGDSRVFYTSLGYPDDFEEPRYRNLLINAIDWALD